MKIFFRQQQGYPLGFTLGLVFSLVVTSYPALSQVIPDTTLPEDTLVIPNGNISVIEEGTRVGGNLFHSFQEFSVPTGGVAFFNNAVDIQNIINRVTGATISNIDGIIRANGTANLFLINPHGIIFGSNAQLNIGGSFIGSTANSIKFADGSEFSATTPQAPPLLTLNVPIGLQFGSRPAPIVNRSVANSLLTGNPGVGLETLPGKTLVLAGGDLLLDGGNLTAFQGQIELGSVASSGLVTLTSTQGEAMEGIALDYQGMQNFGIIELSRAASVNVSGLGGGTIRVRGGQVTLTENSRLVAETFGSLNGGGIDIQATQFNLQQGAFASTSTFGSGTGGSLRVRANTLELTGTTPLLTSQQLLAGTFNPLNLSDGLFSLSGGSGAAGDIEIDTDRLTMQNGANLLTPALLNGNGGDLTLRISELAELSDGSLAFTGTAGTGNGGNLAIAANQLRVLNGTSISTTPGITSTGSGGNLTVTAESVELRGTPAEAVVPGGLFTTTLGAGNAGNITVTTGQLVVADGTQISTSTSGAGEGGDLTVTADSIELNDKSADGRFLGGLLASASLVTVPGQPGDAPAGNLTITTRRLSVQNGAQITAATGRNGLAGNLIINASESVDVSGFATGVDPSVEAVSFGIIGEGIVPSSIEANTRGAGDAGDLMIETGQLTVRDGAEIGVRSTSSGSAGNLKVTADSILLEDQGTLSAVNFAGSRGGNIELTAPTIQLNNGIINASTLGSGIGGNVTIRASDSLEVLGSGLPNLLETIFFPALSGTIDIDNTRQGIVTTSAEAGDAGKITIETGYLRMREGGLIATIALGEGDAGDLRINTSESINLSSSFMATTTIRDGDGGNIEIDTRNLLLQDVAAISAASLSSGRGGNLAVQASQSVELSGELLTPLAPNGRISTNLTASAGAFLPTTGDGGDISITTFKLIVRDGAEVSVDAEGSGDAGSIEAKANSVLLDGGRITATSFLGEGGDIALQVEEELFLRNRSQISTTAGTQATGGGNGGNIRINTGILAVLENSTINANAFQGAGGNIRITTQGIFAPLDRAITASSTLGVDGVVEINRLSFDPSQGLVELPENLTDPSDRIIAGCPADRGNYFAITGRGGLPEDPTATLTARTVWRDLRPLAGRGGEGGSGRGGEGGSGRGGREVVSMRRGNSVDLVSGSVPPHVSTFSPPSELVEAQGWVMNANGQVELVAHAPEVIPQTLPNNPVNCSISKPG